MEHRAARTFVGASAVGTGVTRVILRSDTGDKATPVAPSALSCDTVFVADSRFPFDAVRPRPVRSVHCVPAGMPAEGNPP